MANRRVALIQSATLNGIDFVEVATDDQKTLKVHFLNAVTVAGMFADKDVTITGGDTIPSVAILPLNQAADWSTDGDGNPVLTLRVAAPGDFSTYVLAIDSPSLDRPYFSQAVFSFKARCESTLDCAAPAPVCPGPIADVPPIDYLAKDFLSFRKALADFSALRYPEWKERSEADFGVMMMEALSALADDLSYTQDRVAAESSLETATQRRSLVRHARLVDYEPQPALAASVLLQFTVQGAGAIPAGLLLSAAGPDGSAIYFETGHGLADSGAFDADERWNERTPYYFDDSEQCLKAGATAMWVEGQGWGFTPGQLLLIETAGATTADPPLRQVVQLDSKDPAFEMTDALFGVPLTRLKWRVEDALTADRDLTRTKVKGNLITATQGRRYTESFAVANPPAAQAQLPRTVFRTGPNQSSGYLYTLQRTGPVSPLAGSALAANSGVAWLPAKTATGRPSPEVRLLERRAGDTPLEWVWKRWLLDAGAFDAAFTLDAAYFAPVGTNSDKTVQMDYVGDQGDTVRFGDGVFGDIPEEDAVFTVTYRIGGGKAGNVSPDAVWRIEAPSMAISVTNPFAGTGGADAETPLSILRKAPEAFRAVQYRAVRQEDYEAAAESLDWVQRAGTTFRWTGSWMTVFTAPDPKSSVELGVDQHVELIELLNRRRLAGYESYVPNPRYAALDLKISLCARADAFRGDVRAAVLRTLSTAKFVDGSVGFFHPDNFTFGQPLERSVLEAAIQNTAGVGGVISVSYRRRGYTNDYVNMPGQVVVGLDEIVLVENDPSRPDRGSIRITVEGGK
ncbi:MAG: hypothetical protein IT167_24045 [Bryobacterales bacterium]|nr:hypothetical protein [Bryobacterales bacterium]